jgi:hypothetical protein
MTRLLKKSAKFEKHTLPSLTTIYWPCSKT